MKKALGILFLVCVAAVSIYFFKRGSTSSRPDHADSAEQREKDTPIVAAPPVRISKQTLRHKAGDAAPLVEESDPNFRSFTQSVTDFSKGELQNMKIEAGTLQLGDDPAFTPRLQPYRLFGNYVSPEQSTPEPFDGIIANVDTKLEGDNAFVFEMRTRNGGVWTTWTEISPDEFNHAVSLEQPADAWQYRITLFANDPVAAPKIGGVKISTRKVSGEAP